MAVTFQYQIPDFKVKESTRLKTWVKNIILLEKKIPGDLNFVFMDDAALLTHNKNFLSHDTLTDIITFDYCEKNRIAGDILISVDRVSENAKKFAQSFDGELKRVMIHGVLHLCGYGDKSKEAKLQMTKKENWALKKF